MDEIIGKLVEDAKAENWKAVDEQILEIVKNPIYVKWAYDTALADTNKHVRDLGASILEKAIIDEKQFSEMRDKLYQRMIFDSNMYVRYRSAFALAAHNPRRYTAEVLAVINIAVHDKDIGESAKEYLKRLGK
jgi:hypothetical protein